MQHKFLNQNSISGVHTLLRKLQFLFELPSRLKKCIEMKQYSLAVRYYSRARDVLLKYQDMSSFRDIQKDCEEIVNDLIGCLKDHFRNPKSSPKQLTECVDLLLQLKEPANELCDEYLAHAKERLDENLLDLTYQVTLQENANEVDKGQTKGDAKQLEIMDILEFTDHGCNNFLSNISLVIASYCDLFYNRNIGSKDEHQVLDAIAQEMIAKFVSSLMGEFFKVIEQRFDLEINYADDEMLVRSLDRLHRRLQAVEKLMPQLGVLRSGGNIIKRVAHKRVEFYSLTLQRQFSASLTDMRQVLAAPKVLNNDQNRSLSDLCSNIHSAVVGHVKTALTNLKSFISEDITFAVRPYFRGPFCSDDIRESMVVNYISYVINTSKAFFDNTSEKTMHAPPSLILLLSRLCLDMQDSIVDYLLSLTDQQFPVDEKMSKGCVVTSVAQLTDEAKTASQLLINHFVRIQGLTVSQMIRKSVETRDWLGTIEPRTVRSVMKRVVEDITAIDADVGSLFEEGSRKAHSSDSSKWTYNQYKNNQRSQWSYTPSTGFDQSLLSNIQKLFSEKIEIFSPVEFSKVSILTGIIKITLKTLLECVRLRIFSKFGLQQVQVDAHYLQMYLWRFVSDEKLVYVMLDEVVNSTVHRCVEPEMMESSVVEVICERG
ncbi:vacuolar protein sorting-associated protein 51 homolog isoform X2 [Xenia sp. Carnegie-2017]|uniref:vacuolar protein sorting-associated protein 51 homolog isoform X2 n=1 Tax=Xenia sp. Carnegie-2017 TaxID=2897299 RepID=UPI001F046E63|nr:vacuolar protein sorting-associated protein 51 homolog isoform X2 [Xenia sp. Carnegie-2017]